jgi:mercuric ion binding protein
MRKTLNRFIMKLGVIALLILLFNSVSSAQIREVRIRVDGLACPFCAYGLEKKLKSLEGLESVNVSLKKGLAEIHLKKENSLDLSKIKVIVRDSGYLLKGIEISAIGYVVIEEDNFLFNIEGNPGKFYLFERKHIQGRHYREGSFIMLNTRVKDDLIKFHEDKTPIKITGPVHEHPDGSFGLSIDQYSIVEGKE